MNESLPRRFATVTRQASTAAVVLVLAYLFSQFLPHGGVGDGDPAAPSDPHMPVLPAVLRSDNPSPDAASEDAQTPAVDPIASGVLTVLIDERSYFVLSESERVDGDLADRSTSLDRICALAQLATGDANGIRVRILRRTTARASAEQRLLHRLAQDGIEGDRVYMPSDLEP